MDLHPIYLQQCVKRLDFILPGAWNNLASFPTLPVLQAHAVVTELLECACQAQNVANIQIGRYGLSRIPREWMLQNIESIAEAVLNLNDEWEFQRFLEVYALLDDELYQRLMQRGHRSPNVAMSDVADDRIT